MAVSARLIEGVWGQALHYHLDLDNDVLYLRLLSRMDAEAYGEDTADGFTLLRSLEDDIVVGMVVVSYWKRFGTGAIEDATLRAVESSVERVGRSLPIAA